MLATIQKSSVELEIDRLGLAYHIEPQYDLSLITGRVQVRDSDHYAPQAQVQQYAVQMGETQFPPIVVTKNGKTIDGNTRVEARKKRKEKFCHAIIIDVDFGANEKKDAYIRALAATLNQMGGQRLTTQETRVMTKELARAGWKPDAIARAVGSKSSAVTAVRREIEAESKFSKVGFTKGNKLANAVYRTFGLDWMVAINDVPYKKLAELAVDANLSITEIKEMAQEMQKTGSDSGMIAHVDGKRDEMEQRIREHAILGNGKPPASSQLRRVLGFINGFANTPGALVEQVPAVMEEHLKAMESAINILKVASKAQKDLIDG